jgi:hypothetical protein
MKKIVLLTTMLVLACNITFAQCVEVKGVETKQVCYEGCNPDGSFDGWRNGGTYYTPIVGFNFNNLNKYQVTIEAELWWKGYTNEKEDPNVQQTKTFVIEAGENYVWKVGLKVDSWDYKNSNSPHNCYVKFKVFKCPQ